MYQLWSDDDELNFFLINNNKKNLGTLNIDKWPSKYERNFGLGTEEDGKNGTR